MHIMHTHTHLYPLTHSPTYPFTHLVTHFCYAVSGTQCCRLTSCQTPTLNKAIFFHSLALRPSRLQWKQSTPIFWEEVSYTFTSTYLLVHSTRHTDIHTHANTYTYMHAFCSCTCMHTHTHTHTHLMVFKTIHSTADLLSCTIRSWQ